MVLKVVRYIVRYVGGKLELDIVGKKASIIELCKKGKLHHRKCRKYRVIGT